MLRTGCETNNCGSSFIKVGENEFTYLRVLGEYGEMRVILRLTLSIVFLLFIFCILRTRVFSPSRILNIFFVLKTLIKNKHVFVTNKCKKYRYMYLTCSMHHLTLTSNSNFYILLDQRLNSYILLKDSTPTSN